MLAASSSRARISASNFFASCESSVCAGHGCSGVDATAAARSGAGVEAGGGACAAGCSTLAGWSILSRCWAVGTLTTAPRTSKAYRARAASSFGIELFAITSLAVTECEMVERNIFGAADGFEQEFSEGNGDSDFGHNVFVERVEEVKAASRIVEDRGSDLRELPLDPGGDFVDGANTHFCDGRTKALAGVQQLGGSFELALGDGAFAEHHFAEAVLAVAAGGEDELTAVEKELALDAALDELELASEASGIDFVEQCKQLVMTLNFTGIQRQDAAREPARGRWHAFQTVFLRERFDETMQAGAVLGTHVHELDAHAVAAAAVADDGAGAHFTAGKRQEEFH